MGYRQDSKLERYSEEAKRAARLMRNNGMELREIAKELGVSHQTIHRWVSPKAEETQALYKERRIKYIQQYKRDYMRSYRVNRPSHGEYNSNDATRANDAKRKRAARERRLEDPILREAYLNKRREYARKRYRQIRDNPVKVITNRLRTRVRRAIKEGRKADATVILLGCAIEDLLVYWDQLYTPSWRNSNDLHIDHIRPCASFDLTNKQHQYVCFNWRNLQLLSKEANLVKGCSWTPEMETEWMRMMRENGFDGELFPVFH